MVLISTPGRRMTSRNSLPMKEPMRMRLPIRSVAVALGAPSLDEAGEDVVERWLQLLDPGRPHANRPHGLDDAGRQGRRIGDGCRQRARPGLSNVLDPRDVRKDLGVNRAVGVDLEDVAAE